MSNSALARASLLLVSVSALACGEVDTNPDGAPQFDAGNTTDGGDTGDATLAIDKTSNDFGTVLVDQTSGTATFVVSNDGDGDSGTLSVSLGGANADQFSITSNGCANAPLTPSATCSVSIEFAPTAAGAASATLSVSASPGGTVTASLSGTGAAPGALSMSPSSVPFGDILVGQTSGASTVTVTNTGDQTSGTIAVGITGTDAGYFTITSDACNGSTLASGATCNISLTFTPSARGGRAASLTATADPGGTAVAALSGTGLAPATLSMSPTSFGFGDVLVGANSTAQTFTVTNDGDVTSGTMTTTETGANPGQFDITTDSCDGQTLVGGASCSVIVVFNPTTDGAKSAGVQVAGSPGGTASATFTGTGLDPAVLGANATSHDFGLIEVTQSSGSFTWTISNSGDVPTGTLAFNNNNTTDYSTSTTCGSTLAGNSSCNVTVTFNPAAGGAQPGQISMSATPGGSVALSVDGDGGWRLTILKTGTGTVSSGDGGIGCGADCFGIYAPGTNVDLEALATNGSNYSFRGFGGGGCPSLERFCTVTVNAAMSVSALFATTPNNLIFVSSKTYPTNLGNATKYDTECNALATTAGINVAGGNGYIAVTSDAASTARGRIGNARGWRRMDNESFADSSSALFDSNQVFHSIMFDENGVAHPNENTVMTATQADGSASGSSCENFTNAAATGGMSGGVSGGGPLAWTSQSGFGCSGNYRVVCMGISKFNQMTPTVTTGKKIWVSASTFKPGTGEAADTRCARDIASGVNSVKAMIAYNGAAASAVLNATTTYVRIDGTLVGTGAEIAAMAMHSGIWQTNTGSYSGGGRVWSGQTTLTAGGTNATTCTSWTSADAAASARTGWPDVNRSWFWSFTNQNCNYTGARVYCVEQ